MVVDARLDETLALREHVPYALFIQDLRNGQMRLLNHRFKALLGRDEAQLLGAPLETLVHPEDAADYERAWQAWREANADAFETEARFRHADGSWRWIWMHFDVIERDHGGGANGYGCAATLLGSALDVTHRRARESKQTESQKLDVVSRLSGSVAHDFNNFLTVIIGNVSLALERAPEDATTRLLLEEIAEVAQHAAIVTRQLLSFAHKEVVRPEPVQPNELLESIRRILRRLLPEKVELLIECEPALGRVVIDRVQLALVVLALVTNARDAIANGGTIAVRTGRRPLPTELIPSMGEGRGCVLLVSDTGGGMDAGTVAQIFEPFFSTKTDRGSGLGLTTVRAIVEAAGGRVRVHSEKGRGTEVEVWFKEVLDAPGTERVEEGPAVPPPRGTKVLLVEDDPLVAKVARNLLMGAGYQVLRANDGEAGLAVFDAHAAEIGLVLSDVVMPRLSGVELAVKLRAMRPTLPVVLMSGYTQHELERPHGLGEIVFVSKPFTAAVLLEAVARAWAT